MTVPLPKVQEAFAFFLGCQPDPEALPQFASVPEMNRRIMASPEFRASPKSRKTPLRWPLRQVFVSRKSKVIYCPIGKNACTFLKQHMLRISGIPHSAYIMTSISPLTDHVRTGLQLSDYPEPEVEALISDPGYFKFAVLRDPADRLLSAYFEKFVVNRTAEGNKHHTGKVVRAVQEQLGLGAPDFDRGISFRDFVAHVTAEAPETLDPHWRPQYLHLAGISWDRLFRFDQLGQVVDELEARSGLTLPRQPANSTGSGQGELHLGAADLLPAELLAFPKLSKASFFDEPLEAAVAAYYRRDRNLLDESG
jgi:hypothetical protein